MYNLFQTGELANVDYYFYTLTNKKVTGITDDLIIFHKER